MENQIDAVMGFIGTVLGLINRSPIGGSTFAYLAIFALAVVLLGLRALARTATQMVMAKHSKSQKHPRL